MWLLVAILVLGATRSVKFLYDRFVRLHWRRSLRTMYNTVDSAKNVKNARRFGLVTARILLGLVPPALGSLPVLLVVDDTIVEKFSRNSECVRMLFDHSTAGGGEHVSGHCFVTLAMAVPVAGGDGQTVWLMVPLGHRMWEPDGESKLVIARDSILGLWEALADRRVILLADSWYLRAPLLQVRREWDGFDFVCAARINTAMYGPKPGPAGKRGAPCEEGAARQRRGLRASSIPDPRPVRRPCTGAHQAVRMGNIGDGRRNRPATGRVEQTARVPWHA